jgi:hypothetical protein
MGRENLHRKKLPIFYRLILKLPKPTLERFPQEFQGIFWAIIIPVFLACEFFLGFFLLISFSFPLNLVLTMIIPTIFFIVFVRVRLELDINFLDLIMGKRSYEWNVENAVNEYIDLLQKTKTKKGKK